MTKAKTVDLKTLHQGMFLDGEKPNRRWIAVILSEEDIESTLEFVNQTRKFNEEKEIKIDDLDLDYLARKYSDAMTEGWFDTMNTILEFEPERFFKSK